MRFEENENYLSTALTAAIVGRPNVGKSSLFNKLSGRRISIVHDSPGVTRDFVTARCDWGGKNLTLIDTGGLECGTRDFLLSRIESCVLFVLDFAGVIIFVTDLKSSVTPMDREIALMLKKHGGNVILCVNKCDDIKSEANIYEFYSLGLGTPFAVSSLHGHGTGDLLDAVCEKADVLKTKPKSVIENLSEKLPPGIIYKENIFENKNFNPELCRLAVMGKPNVGKSSLINKLCGQNRSIVSDIPGTTRDSLDTFINFRGKEIVLTDTAGIRKNNRAKDEIEKYSEIRAVNAAKRSDICVVLIDARSGVTCQDAKIAGISRNEGKGCIILVNKWDKLSSCEDFHGEAPENFILPNACEFEKSIRHVLPFLSYAPVIFVSAKTGRNMENFFESVEKVFENFGRRISTSVLNAALAKIMFRVPPPSIRGKQLKIYYAVQTNIAPPAFVFFVNKSVLFHFSYKRYIENRLRENFDFSGTPIKFVVRQKNENIN